MSDKASKRPPGGRAGGRDDDAGVLGSLPSARPSRLGRQGRDAAASAPPRAAKRPAGKGARAGGPKRAAGAAPRAAGPRAVRAGAPSLGTSPGPAPPGAEERPEPPSGAELLTTALRATGELAQIGVTLAGLLVRRVLRGLPRL